MSGIRADDVAFIICNGESRQGFDLDLLKNKGTSFGCNALYRVWNPDYIVSIDQGITSEIFDSEWPAEKHIVPPYIEQFEPKEFNPSQPRSNAGMNAMIEAIKKGYKQLYVLGMDFVIDEEGYQMSNIFDGTDNYGMETRATMNDQINRMNYLSWFCRKHNDISFKFVIPRDVKRLRAFDAGNVTGLFYDQLENRLESIG